MLKSGHEKNSGEREFQILIGVHVPRNMHAMKNIHEIPMINSMLKSDHDKRFGDHIFQIFLGVHVPRKPSSVKLWRRILSWP